MILYVHYFTSQPFYFLIIYFITQASPTMLPVFGETQVYYKISESS